MRLSGAADRVRRWVRRIPIRRFEEDADRNRHHPDGITRCCNKSIFLRNYAIKN
jgi:hypothetical protein